MKLLSLNVALFEKNNEKLKTFIEEQNVDIICLQEVTKKIDQQANDDYISIDSINSSSARLPHSFFAPTWVLSKFEKTNFHGKDLFRFELGGNVEFGQYTKSVYPIIKGQNIFVQNNFSYITDWSKWPDEDYRAVQITDIKLPNTKLRILNYHGIWSKDKRGTDKTLRACQRINELANEVDYPTVICGDFNLFPETPSMHVFSEHINLLNKYDVRSTRPDSNELNQEQRNVVDYILVSKSVTVNNFKVIDSDVSDHLPLVMDFTV